MFAVDEQEPPIIIVTRLRPGFALSAASFVAAVPDAQIEISISDYYHDINPYKWEEGRKILLLEHLRHQLVKFQDPVVIGLRKQIAEAGHRVMCLEEPVPRAPTPEGKEGPDHLWNFSRIFELTVVDPGPVGYALAYAADTIVYEREPSSRLVRFAKREGLRLFGHLSVDRARKNVTQHEFHGRIMHLISLVKLEHRKIEGR